MDRGTQKRLAHMGKRVFTNRDMKQLVEEQPVYTDEEKRQVREMYNKVKSPRHRAALRRIMEDGSLEQTRQVINEEKRREMDEKMERRIQSEVKSGRLPPAKEDAFMRRLRKRR